MKKSIILILAITVIFALAGCVEEKIPVDVGVSDVSTTAESAASEPIEESSTDSFSDSNNSFTSETNATEEPVTSTTRPPEGTSKPSNPPQGGNANPPNTQPPATSKPPVVSTPPTESPKQPNPPAPTNPPPTMPPPAPTQRPPTPTRPAPPPWPGCWAHRWCWSSTPAGPRGRWARLPSVSPGPTRACRWRARS